MGARLAAVLLILIAPARVVRAQGVPGDLDPSFGTGGKVTTSFGTFFNSAYAIAIQADGKIVAAGGSGSGFALARYNVDGSLDPSFGSGGKVTTALGIAFAVAIQMDGKIVAAGGAAPGGFCCQFALARYNADGSLDPSFDGDGIVTTSFTGISQAFALAIQPDARIVAAGSTNDPFVFDFAFVRYNADGSLDATFGVGGKLTTDFGGFDGASGVAIQGDGKIVAVGAGGPNNDFVLARYDTNGSLDPSFGTGGKVTTDFGGFDRAEDVAIQADDKIVAAGNGGSAISFGFALARYNPDGSLDTSFGTGGQVITNFGGDTRAFGVAVQANQKIVAVGFVSLNDLDFALARYDVDGSLDATFGVGGKVTTAFGTPSDDLAQGVAVQTDGKIVAAGGAGPCTPACMFALARYLGDPTPSVPFSAFSARLKIALGPGSNDDAFEMKASASNGIDPPTEDVNLQIGTFATTIPAGSFMQVTEQLSTFQGVISGVALDAIIRSSSHGRFLFAVTGQGADLTGTVNPVPVLLTIGNDTGSTTVVAEF